MSAFVSSPVLAQNDFLKGSVHFLLNTLVSSLSFVSQALHFKTLFFFTTDFNYGDDSRCPSVWHKDLVGVKITARI